MRLSPIAPPASRPSKIEITSALSSAQRKLARRSNADSIADGKRLADVLAGRFAENSQEFLNTLIVMLRAAPYGTANDQIAELALSTAGPEAQDIEARINTAREAARLLPPLLGELRHERPAMAAVGPDEFVNDTSGTRAGKVSKDSLHNFDVALTRLGYGFRYNLFARRKLVAINEGAAATVEDHHIDTMMCAMEGGFDCYPSSTEKFMRFINDAAMQNAFHPVVDYLDALPEWDGVSRCETWLIDLAGVEDTPYTRAVSRLVLVAAVRRVRQPGCKFDEMLILEGAQGTQKSTALQTLCPHRDWFTDEFDIRNDTKTQMEQTAGKWIVEAGELKGMSAADQTALKSNMSRQVDEARQAYGREKMIAPRQFVIIGTTNESEYLKDPTGDRRFWPVKITRMFDLVRLREIREQLWAEASALDLQHPEETFIRLDPELYEAARTEQDRRKMDDPYTIRLEEIIGDMTGRVRVTDIWRGLGFDDGDIPKTNDQRLMNVAMKTLGFERVRVRNGGVRVNYYCKGTEEEQKIVFSISQVAGGMRATPTSSSGHVQLTTGARTEPPSN